jgi:hypothetical protein
MHHDPKTGEPDPDLAAKLFNLVEPDQGHAFISDGIEVLSRAEILSIARASLQHSENVCRKLRKFLKHYDWANPLPTGARATTESTKWRPPV